MQPKKNSLILVLLIVLVIGAALYLLLGNQGNSNKASSNSSPVAVKGGQTVEVTLAKDGFMPAEVTIKAGDSVRFKSTLGEPFWPASDLHPTHGIYPEFDPLSPIEANDSWTFQFLKSGRWKFHDHLNPMFRGVVVVS